jgi:hypothetical protein
MSTTVGVATQEKSQPPLGDEFAVLRNANGKMYLARIACESFSTIAVTATEGTFRQGEVFEVSYGGATLPATVRRADEQPDGSWIVALRWGQ